MPQKLKVHVIWRRGRVRRFLQRLLQHASLVHINCPTKLSNFSNINFSELEDNISGLSTEWRRAALPSINKLHIIKAHLADFLKTHMSWRLFGKQGLESLHHIENMTPKKCFGIKTDDRLPFFLKRQLLASFSDTSEFKARRGNRSGTPTVIDDTIYEDEMVIGNETEIEWHDQ